MREKSKEGLRIKKLQNNAFCGAGEHFLLTSKHSIMYLTGFKGGLVEEPGAIVLICPKGKNIFVTDRRYKEQIKKEVNNNLFKVVIATDPFKKYLGTLRDKFTPNKSFRFLVEDDHVTRKTEGEIKKWWPSAVIVDSSEEISKLRIKKDKEEIHFIEKAVKITEQALEEVLKEVCVGMKERNIASRLGFYFQELGASGNAFPLQVLSGKHSVLPHGVAGDRKIQKGDVLQFDIGCVYNGYCSDISRVFIVGANPNSEQRKVHEVIRNAQEEAIACIKPGVDLCEVFKKHRTILRKAGFEPMHGLGHGIGLEVHEKPVVNLPSFVAQQGMIITCEPGIYIPGKFGMRIEEDILITRNGCRVLTSFPKDLQSLDV